MDEVAGSVGMHDSGFEQVSLGVLVTSIRLPLGWDESGRPYLLGYYRI